MIARRGTVRHIASGPGRLGRALGITLPDSGKRFGEDEFVLEAGPPVTGLLVGPRIGITRAADRPWRFGLAGAPGLSRTFPTRDKG
jgi:DNA-3-methyladenine glycosylase